MKKHIKTISSGSLKNTKNRGCGECAAPCQSASKIACAVANQKCEKLAKG